MAGQNIATAYVQILPTTSGIQSGIAQALTGTAVTNAASSAGAMMGGTIGGAMTAAMGSFLPVAAVAAGGAALISFGKEAVQTGMQFDESMSRVYSLMSSVNDGAGLTEEEMERLRTRAREMGATTVFTAAEVADAMQYMALAGWKVDEVYEGIPDVLNLAASSQMDLGQASDIVTDYTTAFSKTAPEAAELVDVLAYAQANSNSTTFQFASAWQYAAANMNIAGQDVKTVTSMLAYMANSGHKASTAGTELNAMFTSLIQAMDKDGNIAINGQTVALADAEGHWRNMIDIIADVQQAMSGIDPDSPLYEAALAGTFGNVRSMRAIATLLNGDVDTMKEFEAELAGAEGTAEKQAGIMTDNLSGDLKLLNSALDELRITVSDTLTPVLRELVQFLTQIVGWVNQWGEAGDATGKSVDQIVDAWSEISDVDVDYVGRQIWTLMDILSSDDVRGMDADRLNEQTAALLSYLKAIKDTDIDTEAGAGVIQDLAEALGADIDAENVEQMRDNLVVMLTDTLSSEALRTALNPTGEDAAAGISEGMEGYDFTNGAQLTGANLIAAIDNAIQANSPARALFPTGEYAAAGIGQGMALYDFMEDANRTSSAIQSALSAALAGNTYQAYGLGIAQAIANGLTSGQGLIAAAVQAAASLGVGSVGALAYTPAGGTNVANGFTDPAAFDRLQDSVSGAVTEAMSRVAVTMDGERVGRLTADTVSREIERSARAGRFTVA